MIEHFRANFILTCSYRFVPGQKSLNNARQYSFVNLNQRTNGPENAHLISWPSKAQNIQNLENIWFKK